MGIAELKAQTASPSASRSEGRSVMDMPPKRGAAVIGKASRVLVMALVVAAGITLIAMPSGKADCAGPSLESSDNMAVVGEKVTIRGRYFAPCNDTGGCSLRVTPPIETATLTLHRQNIDSDSTDAGIELGTVPVRDGAFTAVVTIPDVRPGRPYVIVATTGPNRIVDAVAIVIEAK